MLNAEPHPPHIELREPMDGLGGERDAVVGADGARQAVLAEGALKRRLGARCLDIPQAVARQQVAGMLVGDRQWIAVHPVPRPELALEVCRPEIIGRRGVRGHGARVDGASPPSPLGDEPFPREQIADRADRWPRGNAAMPRAEQVKQFLGTPLRMLAPLRAEQLRDGIGDAMGAMVRCTASIGEGRTATFLDPLPPL